MSEANTVAKPKLSDLHAQKAALEKQIADARDAAVVDTLAHVHILLEEADMTVEELIAHLDPKRSNGKAATGRGAPKGTAVAPKYRDPETGATWSGRGLQPKWLRAAVEAGKTPADFAIQTIQ